MYFQQKKVEDINEKRQLVVDYFSLLADVDNWDSHQWIPIDWFVKWLSTPSATDDIPPIDTSSIRCSHSNMDLTKVSRAKCVPQVAAEMLFQKYKNDSGLDETSLCEICVKKKYKSLRFKSSLEKDYKTVCNIIKNQKEV